jgi:RNase adaptor protein for sRNA GlmZ degradation
MLIRLISAGKSAVLGGQINADLYLDCRVVRNPFRDPVLGGKTGDDLEVQAWMVKENPEFLRAAVKLVELGKITAPSRNSFKERGNGSALLVPDSTGGKPFTVCFFCLAGIHRSRSAKHVVGNMLRQRGHQVEVVK